MDAERRDLQLLLAFAYGLQLGRARRLAIELQKLAIQAQLASMASGAAIAIASEDRIECIARAGEVAPQLGSRPEAGLSSECIRTGIPYICEDTHTHAIVDRAHLRNSGVRSVVYVPLFRGMQPAGVLGAFSDQPDNFSEHDLRILKLIGHDVTTLLKWEPTPQREIEDVPENVAGADIEFAVLKLSERGRFRQSAIIGGIVIGIVVLLGAAGWLLGTTRHKSNRAPQVTTLPGLSHPPDITGQQPGVPAAESLPPGISLIEAVRTQTVDSHTFVSVYLSGRARFQVHELTNPDRIYVDFEGVEASAEMKSQTIKESGPVAEFRLAKSASNAARFVMVLKRPCTYLVSETSDPYVIVFDVQPRPARR